jgi:hypothetical protein
VVVECADLEIFLHINGEDVTLALETGGSHDFGASR